MKKIFKSKKDRLKFIVFIGTLVTIFVGAYLLLKPTISSFEDMQTAKAYILKFGSWGVIIIVLLQILQVLFAPFPGQISGLLSGYLYGPIFGTIYTMIGTVIGSYIAFKLSRWLGRPFVKKVIDEKVFDKFDNITKEKGSIALFIIWLLPAFPDDAVCFMAGLTEIKISELVLLVTIGRLPGMVVLSAVGYGFSTTMSIETIILFSVFLILSIVIFIFKNKLEKLILNLLNRSNVE